MNGLFFTKFGNLLSARSKIQNFDHAKPVFNYQTSLPVCKHLLGVLGEKISKNFGIAESIRARTTNAISCTVLCVHLKLDPSLILFHIGSTKNLLLLSEGLHKICVDEQ